MLHKSLSLARSSSSSWVDRHAQDSYVQRARREGYIARSAYKLMYMDDKFSLISLQSTRVAVDLGASPGGWCQVIRQRAHPSCALYGVDLLDLRAAIPGAHFIRGDFSSLETRAELQSVLDTAGLVGRVDLVTSDMCPNRCGGAADRHRISELAAAALDFAVEILAPRGKFVCKVLGSRDAYKNVHASALQHFAEVRECRTPATRSSSDEMFLLGLNRRPSTENQNCAGTASRRGGQEETDEGRYNNKCNNVIQTSRFGLDDWPGALRNRSRRSPW